MRVLIVGAGIAGLTLSALATKVSELVGQGAEVEAFAGKESLARFGLMVGADGIHSTVRRHVAGDVEMRPTGWGGWVWWAPAEAAPHKVVTEYWGAGRFVGIYPIRDKIGVIAAGPVDEIGHAKIGGSGSKLAERFATMVAPVSSSITSSSARHPALGCLDRPAGTGRPRRARPARGATAGLAAY